MKSYTEPFSMTSDEMREFWEEYRTYCNSHGRIPEDEPQPDWVEELTDRMGYADLADLDEQLPF